MAAKTPAGIVRSAQRGVVLARHSHEMVGMGRVGPRRARPARSGGRCRIGAPSRASGSGVVRAASGEAVRSERSTRRAMTSAAATRSSPATPATDSTVAPPANTASCSHTVTFVIVEQVERPAHGLDERPVALGRAASPGQQRGSVGSARRRSHGPRSACDRAAASSIASGRPSSRWQMYRTSASSASLGVKPGRTARDRSTNSSPARTSSSGSTAQHVLAADGEALAARRQHRHGRRRRHDALDERGRRRRSRARSCRARASTRRPRKDLDDARRRAGSRPRDSTPSVVATAADDLVAASHGRQLAERDEVEPVERRRWAMLRATSTASRVLPTPPGPVMVTVLAVRSDLAEPRPTGDRGRSAASPGGAGPTPSDRRCSCAAAAHRACGRASIVRDRAAPGTDRARARRPGGAGGPGRPAAPRAGDRRGTARSSAAPGSGRAAGVPRRA